MIMKEKLLNGVYKLQLEIHKDRRGYFSEIYKKEFFEDLESQPHFTQDNLSFSTEKNTIRGLHFQKNPLAQSKLVTVLSGKVWDVFVDLRKDSSTYKQYGFLELHTGGCSLLIPKGFAHGFCTLEPETLVWYKVDNEYSQEHERGINWKDRTLDIPWPIASNASVIISERDNNLPEIIKLENE